MESLVFNIAKEFSKTPGPRYTHEGPFSGELLRTTKFFELFRNAIAVGRPLTVNLDGTAGYGTSFLEEIFGGLIREHQLDYDQIIKILKVKSDEEPYLIDDIFHYLTDAHAKALVTV